MSNSALYDKDFYAWTTEQAELLREGRLAEIDVQHLLWEVESMSGAERRELVGRIIVIITHLLKWRHQPQRRGRSWWNSLVEQRQALEDHISSNPSLKSRVPEALPKAYRRAVSAAAAQTSLPVEAFPAECPWTFDEIMDEKFLPQG